MTGLEARDATQIRPDLSCRQIANESKAAWEQVEKKHIRSHSSLCTGDHRGLPGHGAPCHTQGLTVRWLQWTRRAEGLRLDDACAGQGGRSRLPLDLTADLSGRVGGGVDVHIGAAGLRQQGAVAGREARRARQ